MDGSEGEQATELHLFGEQRSDPLVCRIGIALAGFGGGSMLAAFALPSLLDRFGDRSVMLAGAAIGTATMAISAALFAALPMPLWGLTALWAVVGFGYSSTLTPSGRLLTRTAKPEDRPAVFAAQFTLSHACWLLLYPLAGWLMTTKGTEQALLWMSLAALLGLCAAPIIWPRGEHETAPGERIDKA